ncbi:kelch-like protein 25 [Oculina patagonica]
MAADSKAESLADLFELQENEILMEMEFYVEGGTKFKGSETNVLSVLNKFRLKGEAGFCDVILEVEGRQLTTHRCVLAANSQFFYSMFSSGMKESNQKLLSLQSVCFTSMSLILDYFYTREIVINDENVLDLLNASSFLLVTPVKNACIQHLSRRLGSDNCFSVLQIAEQFGANSLAEEAIDFIKMNFSIILNSEEFGSISQKELVRFISSDDILVEKEEEVYQSVLKWVKHDEANRVAVLPELLKHLRKDSLPKGFLESELTREPLLMVASSHSDPVSKETQDTKGTKTSKKTNSEMPVQEVRPSTEIRNVMIGVSKTAPRKAFFYDLDRKENLLLTDVSELEYLQQVAVVGQKLYVIGGESYFGIRRLNAVCFDNFKSPKSSASERMHLEWETKAHFGEYRAYASLVNLNGLLYYIGGCHYDHYESGRCRNTVECYNPEMGEWSFCAGLNMARCRFGCVASEQNIYVIGGGTTPELYSEPLASVEKYDPVRNCWSYVATLNEARSFPGCAYWCGKIYVIGGIYSDGVLIYSCEVYSPMTDEWQTIARMPHPYCKIDSDIIIVGNQITVPFRPKQTFYSCEALQYNMQSNEWLKLENFGPSGKKGLFTLCTMKLPGFIVRRIAGELGEVDWSSSDEEDQHSENESERSFPE